MVFSKLKAVFGTGITVDTLLHEKDVTPGGTLKGEVRFTGGDVDAKVEGIEIEFTALVEVDDKGEDEKTTYDYFSAKVSNGLELPAKTAQSVPFEVKVPLETPFNTIEGRPLPGGMKLGVSTKLALDNAIDKGDLDVLAVEPLPVAKAVVKAIEGLGFVFQEADLESGTVQGATVPFYQEIEFWATGGEFEGRIKELEVTFISSETSTDVVFQADNSAELLAPDLNTVGRFTLPTGEADDLTETVRAQLEQLLTQKGA